MEQYKTENAKLEKDLPTLREVAGGMWKKEEELKQLKSEVATLERKIQLTLPSAEKQVGQGSADEKVTTRSDNSNISRTEKSAEEFMREHVIVARLAPTESRANKPLKL